MIIERPKTGLFSFCPSEAASISGSVDDVIEDDILWDKDVNKNVQVLFLGLIADFPEEWVYEPSWQYNNISSCCPPALTIHSSASVQMRWRRSLNQSFNSAA